MSPPGPISDAAMPQRSAAWYAARAGKVTGSRVAEAVTRIKSGAWSASRERYMTDLMAERLTGTCTEMFQSRAMEWGIYTEAEARNAYAFRYDTDVTEVGFIAHPTLAMAGCSPDGLVGLDGMIQIKCPNPSTHMALLLGEAVAPEHLIQVQWEMACAGRQWSDFVSYDPRLPEPYRLFVQRVNRSDEALAILEADAAQFLTELDARMARLAERFGEKIAA